MAYQSMEDETDQATGQPIWRVLSIDPRLAWNIHSEVSQPSAELEEFDKKNSGDKKKPGLRRWVVPEWLDPETPMPDGGLAREAFFREQQTFERELTIRDVDGTELDVDRIKPPGGYNPDDYG